MKTWSVKPQYKKSILERQFWMKDGVAGYITHETGWRGGEFIVTTEDENPPVLESGVDIYACGYDSELVETFDGCWEEVEYDLQDSEVEEEVRAFLEENSIFDLEELGWYCDDTEMIIDCDMIIEEC